VQIEFTQGAMNEPGRRAKLRSSAAFKNDRCRSKPAGDREAWIIVYILYH
jgi:hypothetical protein